MVIEAYLAELQRTRDETLKWFALNSAELAKTYAPGKWNVRYLLNHLADSETVLLYRLKRVISEPDQQIRYYDEAAWAQRLDYATMPLEIARELYRWSREAVLHLAPRHYEGSDKISFVHSTDGVRTLRDEFDKVAWHNEHHLVQIRAAVSP
jgi:hypothetical protein